MSKKESVLEYMTAEDFFVTAEVTTIQEEVQKETQERQKEEIVDPITLREQKDWSYLANKIVGGEDTCGPLQHTIR